MAEIIRFPDDASPRGGKDVDANTEPATVIILPVIRIDRDPDGSNGLEPQTGNGPGARRPRRPAACQWPRPPPPPPSRALAASAGAAMPIWPQPPPGWNTWRRSLIALAALS